MLDPLELESQLVCEPPDVGAVNQAQGLCKSCKYFKPQRPLQPPAPSSQWKLLRFIHIACFDNVFLFHHQEICCKNAHSLLIHILLITLSSSYLGYHPKPSKSGQGLCVRCTHRLMGLNTWFPGYCLGKIKNCLSARKRSLGLEGYSKVLLLGLVFCFLVCQDVNQQPPQTASCKQLPMTAFYRTEEQLL